MGLTLGLGLGIGLSGSPLIDVTPEFSNFATSAIGDTGFTITLTVNPKGIATTIEIQYGLTDAYGSTQAVVAGSPIAVTGQVSAVLSNLTQNKAYYYRVKAVANGITYYSTGHTQSTTNVRWILPITGRTSGTATAGTMVVSCTEDVTPTVTGDVTISVARAADSIYRKHTLTVNCPNNGSGTIIFPDRSKIVALCAHNGASVPNAAFWAGTNATAPILTFNIDDMPSTTLKMRMNIAYATIFVASGTQALPAGMTYLAWECASDNVFVYTYTGPFPANLTSLYIKGSQITWNNDAPLPTGLTAITLDGALINWTGLDASGTATMTIFTLNNYRQTKMTSAEMVTFINTLTNRVGGLPATITIKDYIDFAAPPQAVLDAVAALKVAKPTVTTVTFGA